MSDPRCFQPSVTWDAEVEAYLRGALGDARFDLVAAALARPPVNTCMRVNTLQCSPEEVAGAHAPAQQAQGLGPPTVPTALPYVVVLPGAGPNTVDYSATGGREVVISRKAGEAVLRGAPVFSPGVLACSAGVSRGDLVAVSVALERPGTDKFDLTRGTTLPDPSSAASTSGAASGQQLQEHLMAPSARAGLFIGVGRAAMSRTEIFRSTSGLAVSMEQPAFSLPSPLEAYAQQGGRVMLQNLPSILAAQVLAPTPGARVIDMCAAPGGKTTMIAQLMRDQGEVIALDRSHTKVADIRALAQSQGLTCITAYKADAALVMNAPAAPQQPAAPSHAAAAGGTAPGAQPGQGQGQGGSGRGVQQVNNPPGEKALARLERRRQAMLARGITPVEEGAGAGPRCPGFDAESFDYVLLDAPCSALGLRPRLAQQADMAFLRQCAASQRRIMDTAVKLLKPGGALVFSTCTINPGENEATVRYVLQKHGHCMRLVPALPRVGGPGLVGAHPQLQKPLFHSSKGDTAPAAGHEAGALSGTIEPTAASPSVPAAVPAAAAAAGGEALVREEWLSEAEAGMVQRFDPADAAIDSIGFFIARFEKTRSWWG